MARMEEKINSCWFFVGILRARDQLEELGADGGILNLILKLQLSVRGLFLTG